MWKALKEDKKSLGSQSPSQVTAAPVWEPNPAGAPKLEELRVDLARTYRVEIARLGKLTSVKGELSGREDLFVDGEVEGSIDLSGHLLTVGPNGRIRAKIQAQTIVVFGRVEGTVRGSERVELRKSAVVYGDILTQRIVIEDGAFLKGGIDTQKFESKSEMRRELATAAPSLVKVAAAGAAMTAEIVEGFKDTDSGGARSVLGE